MISQHQKLSEEFIHQHANLVDWCLVSSCQKLSEEFIHQHDNLVNWCLVSICQKLSEEFIKAHINLVDISVIGLYQYLSKDFIEQNHIEVNDTWLYLDTDSKRNQIKECGLYECYDDYFIAYKCIRNDNYSFVNFQYQYFAGETYNCHADHTNNQISFGFFTCTEEWAEELVEDYCNIKIIKVKIYYKDIARLIRGGNAVRCTAFTVLEEVA